MKRNVKSSIIRDTIQNKSIVCVFSQDPLDFFQKAYRKGKILETLTPPTNFSKNLPHFLKSPFLSKVNPKFLISPNPPLLWTPELNALSLWTEPTKGVLS